MAEEKKDKEKTVKEAPAAAPAAEPKAAAPEAPAAAPAAPADPLATGTEEAKPAPRRRVKGSKNIPVGVVHILASFNNTVVSITDPACNVISWSSGGRCGFKGSRNSAAPTPRPRDDGSAQTQKRSQVSWVSDSNPKQAKPTMRGGALSSRCSQHDRKR